MIRKYFFILFLFIINSYALFSQIRFSADFNTGMSYNIPNIGEGTMQPVTIFGDRELFMFRFITNYSNPNGTAGLLTIAESSGNRQSTNFSLVKGYAWISPDLLDKRLTISMGMIDSEHFETYTNFWNKDLDEGYGLFVLAAPVDNLLLGIGSYTSLNWTIVQNLDPIDMKYTYNAAYTLPDIFKFTFMYRTKNKLRNIEYNWTSGFPDTDTQILFGYDHIAVQNLKLAIDGNLLFLNDWRNNGRIDSHQSLGYYFSDINLHVQLEGHQYIPMIKLGEDGNPGQFYWLWARYDNFLLGKIVPRIDLGFLASSEVYRTYNVRRNHNIQPNFYKDYYETIIWPSLKIISDTRSYLELGYRFRTIKQGNKDTKNIQDLYIGIITQVF